MSSSRFHGYLIKKNRRNKEELAEGIYDIEEETEDTMIEGQKTVLRGSSLEETSCPGTPLLRTRLDGRVVFPEGGYFQHESWDKARGSWVQQASLGEEQSRPYYLVADRNINYTTPIHSPRLIQGRY